MRPDSNIAWRAYPALLLAGCLAAGIAGAAALPGLTLWHWAVGVLAGYLIALVPRPYARRRLVSLSPLWNTLAVALVVAALGGMRYVYQQTLPADHVAHRVYGQPPLEDPVAVTGRVLEAPVEQSSGVRFVLEIDTLFIAQIPTPASGRVQARLARSPWKPEAAFPNVAGGDVVRLEGRLRPTPPRRNPADFDYGRYLRQRGLYATLTVYDTAAVDILGARRGWVERFTAAGQAYVRDRLERHVPTDEARAVLHALVLGDRSSLEEDTLRRFSRTGLMHLLAVSGLHVLLVGMVLYGVLRPVLMRLRLRWKTMELARAAATMALLLAYLFLSGASASVVRAVIMAGLFIGGAVLQRSAHPLNTLGVAGVVLLLAHPGYLFEVGFQLSFAAVAAIVTLHAVWSERLPEAWMARPVLRRVLTMTSVSMAATLGTMPVLLYHFGRVSFAGLLLNLAAIPLTGLTLAAGLAALVLGGGWSFGADVFGAAADALARGLLWTVEAGDGALGWAAVRSYVRDPWYLLGLAAMLLMLAQWPRPRLRWRLGAAALGFAAVGVWGGVLGGAHAPRLEVLFFDVGHGDAALVALPNGRHLLIDAGGRDAFSDQGARTLLPHLERYGIRRLDAVVITHPHSDHLGGLPALLRALPVGRVLHNGQPYPSALYAETTRLLDSLRVPHRAVGAGDTLALDPSVLIQVFAPEPGDAPAEDANEASVVLRLVYDQTVWLFTGDAGAETEQRLLDRYGPLLQSDVVKVGHHGSRTSSTPAFVAQVVPDAAHDATAVVSVGTPALFDLPDEEVTARWRQHGAAVWITNGQGALWLRSDGQRISRIPWR